MGDFAKAEDVKTKTQMPLLQSMDPEDIEAKYIRPAERMIEMRFNLNLNTDRQPRHWAGLMNSDSTVEDQFKADYKSSVYLVVDRLAHNPHGVPSQSVRGASAVYDLDPISNSVAVLMHRWSRPLEVTR